jgi:hypothetical protein
MFKWLSLALPVPLRFTALRKFLPKGWWIFGHPFLRLNMCLSRQQPIHGLCQTPGALLIEPNRLLHLHLFQKPSTLSQQLAHPLLLC